MKEAIEAHCYSCMGYYTDGKFTCNIAECPLFPHMPYNNIPEPSLESIEVNNLAPTGSTARHRAKEVKIQRRVK